MVLMVALAGIGVGYAHWSQTLTIEGTVNTGELDWEFWSGVSIDPQTPETLDWHCNDGFTVPPIPPFWQGDKNVGYTTTVLVDTDLDGDFDRLEVALHNVYPSYFNDISYWVHNNGSIPLIIDRVIIDGQEFTAPFYVSLDLNGDALDDVEIQYGNNFGDQLEPCDFREISFWIHVLQAAPQGESLTFTMELVAIQWNAP